MENVTNTLHSHIQRQLENWKGHSRFPNPNNPPTPENEICRNAGNLWDTIEEEEENKKKLGEKEGTLKGVSWGGWLYLLVADITDFHLLECAVGRKDGAATGSSLRLHPSLIENLAERGEETPAAAVAAKRGYWNHLNGDEIVKENTKKKKKRLKEGVESERSFYDFFLLFRFNTSYPNIF